ncbi:MAG TPA: glycosyltransferase family 2 protein [Dehalococcoidia bacterium]|nr:glycosyltransferase family 2 protein [Dehalococcoidia bacterium]
MAAVDVLIPTYNRPQSLVMTLAGVAAQSLPDLHVVVADQGDQPARGPVADALVRVIEARGGSVEWHERPQVHGIAEQREFLLGRARADAVLYLDDDVFMEPAVVGRMLAALREERCGFVGAFPSGLSFRDDVRPAQQPVEFWDGPVRPEQLAPGDPTWEARWQLHRAANAWHAAQRLPPGEVRRYKVAWVASCVTYDRRKLLDAGGFAFWPRLPRFHSGEEVLVQNLLQRRWGGCALLPSGTYHAELPTTVLNPDGQVDGHALALLAEMVARI